MPFQPGRRKGSRSRKIGLVEAIAGKFNQDPFEILMRFASGDWKGLGYDSEVYVMENAQGGTKIGYTIPPELRASCAKEAAQYLYAKRKEEPEQLDEPIEVMSIEEKREFLEQAEKDLEALRLEVTQAEPLEITSSDESS